MIRKTIEIDVFEVKLEFFEIQESDSIETVKNTLKDYTSMNEDELSVSAEKLKSQHGYGLATHEGYIRSLCMWVGCNNTKESRIGVICHEKRHVEDFITDIIGVNGAECMAYIAEYLGKKILS